MTSVIRAVSLHGSGGNCVSPSLLSGRTVSEMSRRKQFLESVHHEHVQDFLNFIRMHVSHVYNALSVSLNAFND